MLGVPGGAKRIKPVSQSLAEAAEEADKEASQKASSSTGN